ncbi:MAG: FliM/FliN family flagellar motor switch protein [Planctomycetaceae bacterium]|nr:FliM/FliN family flagellar motor switch protein [Planctomycetaceae bacterium]
MDNQASVLTAAEQALCAALPSIDGPSPQSASAFPLENFGRGEASVSNARTDADSDRLDLRVELGRTRIGLGESRRLRSGSVVPLDKLAGEPLDLMVGGRRVAKGELLVVDGKVAVRVVELAGC